MQEGPAHDAGGRLPRLVGESPKRTKAEPPSIRRPSAGSLGAFIFAAEPDVLYTWPLAAAKKKGRSPHARMRSWRLSARPAGTRHESGPERSAGGREDEKRNLEDHHSGQHNSGASLRRQQHVSEAFKAWVFSFIACNCWLRLWFTVDCHI